MSSWNWNNWSSWTWSANNKKDKQDEQWQRVEETDITMIDVNEPTQELPKKVARTEKHGPSTTGRAQASSSKDGPTTTKTVTYDDIDPETGISFKNTAKKYQQSEAELAEQSRRVAEELGLPKEMVDKAQMEVQKMLQKPTKGRITPCCNCGELKYKSELLPIHPLHHTWQGNEYFICFRCTQCKEDVNGKTMNQPLPWSRADYKGNQIRFNIGTTGESSSSTARDEDQSATDPSGTARETATATDKITETMQWLAITPYTSEQDKLPPDSKDVHRWDSEQGWHRVPMFTGTEAQCLKKFKNAAAHAWVQVQAGRKGTFEFDVRDMTYKKYMARQRELYPDRSLAHLRRNISRAALKLSTNLLRALGGDSPEEQAATEAAFEKAEETYKRLALNPEERAELAKDTLSDDRIAQWIDQVKSGIWMFFICRNPNCKKFMKAERWLWNGKNIYYCPMCFLKHSPWQTRNMSDGQAWVPAQKCLVLRDDIDMAELRGEMPAPEETGDIPSGSTRELSAGKSNGFCFYLCEWPETINAQLINDLKMSATKIRDYCADSLNDMDKLEARVVEYAAGLEKIPFMTEAPLTEEMIKNVEWINSQGGHWTQAKLSYEHMPKNDKGLPMTEYASYTYTAGKTHVLTTQDQVQMWALCACQVAAKKKLREVNTSTK